ARGPEAHLDALGDGERGDAREAVLDHGRDVDRHLLDVRYLSQGAMELAGIVEESDQASGLLGEEGYWGGVAERAERALHHQEGRAHFVGEILEQAPGAILGLRLRGDLDK